MLGSGINPESFKQDYSGFTRAAEIQAQGLQNLGQNIGGAIQNYGEAKKEQRKVDAYNKASAKSIEAAITLGDSYGIKGARETLSPFLSAANDPNLSPIEKAALLDEAKAMIPNVFGRFDKSEAVRIEQAAISARNAPEVKPLTFTPDLLKVGGGDVAVKIGSDGNYYDESGQFPITDLQAYAEGQPPEVYSSGARQSAANAIDAGLTLPAYGGANESPPVVYGADGAPMLLPPPVGTFDTPNPLIPIDPSVIDAGIALNAGQAAPVVGEPPASIALPKPAPQLKSRIIQSGEDKQVETFRPATAEESALYGGVPGQMSSKGRFYPITLPTGMTIESDGAGGFKVVQGAGVGKEDKAQRAEAYKAGKATELMKDLNLLESGVTEMAPGIAGAAGRMIAEQVPTTEQADRKAIIDRVKSTLTVAELQAMRNSSPTGASLGNISNMDVGLLKDSATALSNAQSPEAFKRELVRLKNLQHDIIYGSEQQLRENLQKGKITQSEFDESMRMKPSEFINEQGVVTSRSAPPIQGGVELSPEIQEMKRQMEARMREAEARKQAQ